MIVAGLGTAPAYASGTDRNCDDFTSLGELTSYVDANPGDPSGLDADDDGIACEGDFPPGATLVDAAPGEENTDEGSGDTAENSDNSDEGSNGDDSNEDGETMQGGGAMPSGGVQTGEAAVADDAPLVAGGAAVLAGAGLLVLARRRAED